MTWLNLPRNVTCEMTFWGKKLPSSSLLMHNQSSYEKSLLQWLPQWLCMNHCKNLHIKAEADPAVEVLLRWEALPKPHNPTTRTGWALAALCANEGKPTRLLAFRQRHCSPRALAVLLMVPHAWNNLSHRVQLYSSYCKQFSQVRTQPATVLSYFISTRKLILQKRPRDSLNRPDSFWRKAELQNNTAWLQVVPNVRAGSHLTDSSQESKKSKETWAIGFVNLNVSVLCKLKYKA